MIISKFPFSDRYVHPEPRAGDSEAAGTRRSRVARLACQAARLQRLVQRTDVRAARIAKTVGCHVLRYSFATPLFQGGYDIRTVQELPGHADVPFIPMS